MRGDHSGKSHIAVKNEMPFQKLGYCDIFVSYDGDINCPFHQGELFTSRPYNFAILSGLVVGSKPRIHFFILLVRLILALDVNINRESDARYLIDVYCGLLHNKLQLAFCSINDAEHINDLLWS